MPKIITVVATVVAGVLLVFPGGCQMDSDIGLGVVNFRLGHPLRYKISVEKDILIELVDSKTNVVQKRQSHKMSEKLDMVISYRTIEENPFGLTTVRATCESAKVTRSAFTSRGKPPADVMEQMAGRSFTFKVSPTGKVADYSELAGLLTELGKKAFVPNTRGGMRAKNPDMLYDFMTVQWHMWDSIATMKNPKGGVAVGRTWQSDQILPLPVPIPAARRTTYKLSEVIEAENVHKAVITADYELSDAEIKNRPELYDGKFNLKGSLFVVMRNYVPKSIQGGGKQVFDIDRGLIESETQDWKLVVNASFMLPLGTSLPRITIDQKVKINLLEPAAAAKPLRERQ